MKNLQHLEEDLKSLLKDYGLNLTQLQAHREVTIAAQDQDTRLQNKFILHEFTGSICFSIKCESPPDFLVGAPTLTTPYRNYKQVPVLEEKN